jgi:hypothetical protein
MASVVIVSAEIGPAATANPVASVVTRKPRRDQLARGNTSQSSASKTSICVPPGPLCAATISDRRDPAKVPLSGISGLPGTPRLSAFDNNGQKWILTRDGLSTYLSDVRYWEQSGKQLVLGISPFDPSAAFICPNVGSRMR